MAWRIGLLLFGLLLGATGQRPGQPCSETQRFFGKHDLPWEMPISASDPSGVCGGTAQCCSARDDAHLLRLGKRVYSDYLRSALIGNMKSLERAANRLQGSLCTSLDRSFTESGIMLTHTYKSVYSRNAGLFRDFFCSMSYAVSRPNCCYCEREMRSIVFSFLRSLVFAAMKEQALVFSVTKEYKACMYRHISEEQITATFTDNKVTLLLNRLVQHVCQPCHIRQAVKAAHDLIHRSVTTAPSQACLEGMRCMTSCGCCLGDAGCVGRKPCLSCCRQAMSHCVHGGGIAEAHGPFQRLMQELARASNKARDLKSDDVLKSLGVQLSEFIMEVYTSREEVLERLVGLCGAMEDHSVAASVPDTPLECPVCPANVTYMSTALYELEVDAERVERTFSHIPQQVCALNSVRREDDSDCDTCQHCTWRHGSSAANTTTHRMLVTFTEQLPLRFRPPMSQLPAGAAAFICSPPDDNSPVPEESPSMCDDEDNDCCSDGSGSGSGSGGSGSGCSVLESGDTSGQPPASPTISPTSTSEPPTIATRSPITNLPGGRGTGEPPVTKKQSSAPASTAASQLLVLALAVLSITPLLL